MKYDPEKHHRLSTRLGGYDYAQPGAYFVTVCTRGRACLFGHVVNGEMHLNEAGKIARSVWDGLPDRFPGMESDAFVVMPNHVHAIIAITDTPTTASATTTKPRRGESCIRPDDPHQHDSGDHKDRPYGTTTGSLGRIVQAFKSMTTHEYVMGVRHRGLTPFHARLWQRGFYEHVVRTEPELMAIREYIMGNPARWDDDENNPDFAAGMH
jgi:putative transposase